MDEATTTKRPLKVTVTFEVDAEAWAAAIGDMPEPQRTDSLFLFIKGAVESSLVPLTVTAAVTRRPTSFGEGYR